MGGGQGRCERFCENSIKKYGGRGSDLKKKETFLVGGLVVGGGGVRVDVKGEVKFL